MAKHYPLHPGQIHAEPYYIGCKIGILAGIIYTMERPATVAAPSDEATGIRVARFISDDLAVEANVSHIYICCSDVSNDASCMGARRGYFCRYPHTVDIDSR